MRSDESGWKVPTSKDFFRFSLNFYLDFEDDTGLLISRNES